MKTKTCISCQKQLAIKSINFKIVKSASTGQRYYLNRCRYCQKTHTKQLKKEVHSMEIRKTFKSCLGHKSESYFENEIDMIYTSPTFEQLSISEQLIFKTI